MVHPRWWRFAGFASLVALSAGCTASSPAQEPPTPAVSVEAPPAASAGDASKGAAAGSSPAASAKAEEPPRSEITNEPPPGGTVTSNAAPSQGSDRMQAMIDLIKANRDGFRKCFDLWGKQNPGQAGKIAFQFFLKPDGALEKAEMKRDEGDVHVPSVETCMIDFARTLTYPKSAVGKDTVYTHRFEFKAAAK